MTRLVQRDKAMLLSLGRWETLRSLGERFSAPRAPESANQLIPKCDFSHRQRRFSGLGWLNRI